MLEKADRAKVAPVKKLKLDWKALIYYYEEALALQEQYFCLDDKLKEIFLKGEEVTCKENSTLVALQSVLQAFLTLRVV